MLPLRPARAGAIAIAAQPSTRRADVNARAPAASRKTGGQEPAADVEGFVDVGERGCQLCAHAVPGAELDRVEDAESGDTDARVGGGGGPGGRTEEAAAELRCRPDGEGEKGDEAEQPEIGADPHARPRGLGELRARPSLGCCRGSQRPGRLRDRRTTRHARARPMRSHRRRRGDLACVHSCSLLSR